MTDAEIQNIDVRSLQLRPAIIQDTELNDLQYDPHLQEERLRQLANMPGGKAITFTENGKLYVDIIAKLKEEPYDKVPKEVTYLNRIGDRIITGCIEVDQIPVVRKQVESLKAALEIHLHDAESGRPESLGNTRPGSHVSGTIREGEPNGVQDLNNKDNQIDIRLPHLANVPGPWKIEFSRHSRGPDGREPEPPRAPKGVLVSIYKTLKATFGRDR